MGLIATLFVYKLRFFFGPAFRGKLGPVAYLGLVGLLGLYGFFIGVSLGSALPSYVGGRGVDLLSAPLAALMALGLMYAFGAGVTAHASEFDFFMTAPVRPRDYLVSDLLFQFVSLFGAGGVAAVLAAFGIFVSAGRPLALVVPFLLVFLAYAFVVLVVIQILVVLGVRHPKFPMRGAILALLVLSLLPAVSLAVPEFPLRFDGLPFPSSAFGSLGYSILAGAPFDPAAAAVALASVGLLGAAWLALSDTYIFHGIHPSLSAGFGQVDMAARMNQQRRMVGTFSRLTKRLRFRAERGGDVGMMTRLHLVRILRDGSIFFIAMFGAVSLILSQTPSGGSSAELPPTATITQIILLLVGILALNWSYYDRDNLWVVVTTPKTAGPYFRGLLLCLAIIGLLVISAFLLAIGILGRTPLTVAEVAPSLAAQVGAAIVATALLTRIRIKPSAFSVGMLAIMFLPEIGGLLLGLGATAVVLIVRLALGLGPVVEALAAGVYAVVLAAVGLAIVGRLGSSFRL